MKPIRLILLLAPLLAAVALDPDAADGPRFAASGELLRPENYREWIYLSSGLGMNYGPAAQTAAPNPAFDNVFVNRSAYRTFVSTGTWPEGTTFILEIRASSTNGSINRGGHFQSAARAVEAEVKRNGKWTFYAFPSPDAASGKALPAAASCYSCHAEHGAVDNTFVQFYPTLIPVARAKGTYKEPPQPTQP